jgi:hypothetical protein
MAKEWANKDRYNPSHGVPKPRMPLPGGKAVVRSVPAWGDASSRSRGVVLERMVRPAWLGSQTSPTQRGAVRPAWLGGSTAPLPRILGGVVFEVVNREVSVLEVVVSVVGLESQQVVSSLGVLCLVFSTGMGGAVALIWRGGTVHGLPFVILVLLQLERVCSLMVVTVVVFVEVVLVGKMVWFVLSPLSSKWLGTGFTLLVLTPVLSRLFAHVLVFEFQVGDLKNILLIDSGCSRHMTRDKGWFSSLVPMVTKRYITYGDNGRGPVLSEGEIKVSDKITLRPVALVQSLGYNLLSVSQLLDEGFEMLFRPGGSRILDSQGDLVCMVVPEGQVFRANFSVFGC